MPSEIESFGLVALEAMASAVPVISSNTGGISEVNIHNLTGYIANVGDINHMSKKAIDLFSDDKLLLRFKQNAFLHSKKYDLPKILPLYE